MNPPDTRPLRPIPVSPLPSERVVPGLSLSFGRQPISTPPQDAHAPAKMPQPTIYGPAILRDNIEELRKKYGVQS